MLISVHFCDTHVLIIVLPSILFEKAMAEEKVKRPNIIPVDSLQFILFETGIEIEIQHTSELFESIQYITWQLSWSVFSI